MATVARMFRYPVKSMLAEPMRQLEFSDAGVVGDRAVALVDRRTGFVASAKKPSLWRGLLQSRAWTEAGQILVELSDGTVAPVEQAVSRLSRQLGRDLTLATARPIGATVERPDPEDVMAAGESAETPSALLELGQGANTDSFVDWGAVHMITTATLERLGHDAVRYRPNVVISTDDGVTAFSENDWPGRELQIGEVRLRGLIPTPRCAIPTLAHGDWPADKSAVRRVVEHNRVEVPGFGNLPSVGAYLEVLRPGKVNIGDPVTLLSS